MPTGPLPGVAQVLSAAGVELAVEAGRTVYEDRPGWFASDAAHGPLREWTHGLTMSFAGGAYGEMSRQVAALMQSATA